VRVNEEIYAREIRVIGADGKQVGVMSVSEAMDLARQSNLDLIEIAPQAKPPVCRVQDYGKFRFEQTKKEKEARKTQSRIEIKEIRLRPKTAEHDTQVRLRAARKFLVAGAKVKVWLRFRGREVTHPEVAMSVMRRIADELSDISSIEQHPSREGRTMLMILAPAPGKKAALKEQAALKEAASKEQAAPTEQAAPREQARPIGATGAKKTTQIGQGGQAPAT